MPDDAPILAASDVQAIERRFVGTQIAELARSHEALRESLAAMAERAERAEKMSPATARPAGRKSESVHV